ncbi:MAG: cytochrome b/b6 domain-containing protein [Pseudomonadota bacterium]|nr:cytochrome b/b6 domain-containing protein [Pseudomonadota bacterium]
MQPKNKVSSRPGGHAILVWDLPVRLFHWSLVLLLVTAWVTAHLTLEAMYWHKLAGYAILSLILFRIVWGFAGSRHARFADFIRGPGAALRHLHQSSSAEDGGHPIGHNPLGGYMVLLLMLLVLIQALTGLFASDQIMIDGPLVSRVSSDVSEWATRIHKININILIIASGVHIAAILFYLFKRSENLIRPMITGYKDVAAPAEPLRPGNGLVLQAAVIFAAAVAVVWMLVRFGGG